MLDPSSCPRHPFGELLPPVVGHCPYSDAKKRIGIGKENALKDFETVFRN